MLLTDLLTYFCNGLSVKYRCFCTEVRVNTCDVNQPSTHGEDLHKLFL